jgi:exopolysaccharide biosynthesis polyprenyl glycosylphosphotransferase
MSPRTPATRASLSAGIPALKAQRLVDLFALRIAPAFAGALIAWSHFGSVGAAAIVLGSLVAAGGIVERSRVPLHLISGARVVLAASGPVLGGAFAWLVCLAAGDPVPLGDFVPIVIGAWLLLALGAWVKVRASEHMDARVAVIGSAGFARDLATELAAADVGGYSVVGWIGQDAPQAGNASIARLSASTDLREAVLRYGIDLLVVAPPESARAESEHESYERAAGACLDLPVRMINANQLYEELLGHVPLGTIDATWFRYIMHPRFTTTPGALGRAFDVVLGSLMSIVAAPILVIAAIAIKVEDGGPIFYRQRRLGEHGQPFEIIKLRSMRKDAESDGGARWSWSEDDRITAVGRVLRRTHVDELPQLWNVLRGQMTLVGPRPERPEMAVDLEQRFRHYSRRSLVKPGLTGWAQVRCGYAGSESGTAWKLCHDLFYVKHRSFLADVLILIQTAFEATKDAHRALRAPRRRFIVREQRGS